jgi:hypothetical protein
MWLAAVAESGELPGWAAQLGLPGVCLAALALVVRVLFKQLQTRYEAERELLIADLAAERARADKLEAQLSRYADDERKRYGELQETLKTVGGALDKLRTERRRS